MRPCEAILVFAGSCIITGILSKFIPKIFNFFESIGDGSSYKKDNPSNSKGMYRRPEKRTLRFHLSDTCDICTTRIYTDITRSSTIYNLKKYLCGECYAIQHDIQRREKNLEIQRRRLEHLRHARDKHDELDFLENDLIGLQKERQGSTSISSG